MYIHFPQFSPIIFSIFSIPIRWYGLMYFLAFIFALWRGKTRAEYYNLTQIEVENLLYSCFIGLFIGGRIGYIIFYNPVFFFENMSHILKIWEGGMSFHGGLLGVIIVLLFFSKKLNKHILEISDFIVPLVPFGLGAGRLGNFINGELWGRIAPDFKFSVLFPNSREIDLNVAANNLELKSLIEKFGVLPRHPSQIYEFVLEGLVLFFVLNYFSKKSMPFGFVSSIFLILYGCFRIFLEIFRQPDRQIGLFLNTFSMGQLLSMPMIVLGILIAINIYVKVL
uniref:Phosphatidylglycerol--prolipoprotein diacylglyceryl transferase n=2 Tax=Buchnera aphidicola TaxID=9 RepID=LGT_BUCBP|nr:RecName: Full=Phosphatidylglycerol--prolipoprotein diacylglyceryl transferase [Buchnera aphidicola str. Bp (Baizongia pistaciae)]